MADTGNKRMDIRISKLENERSIDDSATVYVGAGKQLCESGPMTDTTVETAEMLISVLQDEHGIAKSNIDIRTSTSKPNDPCICLIFWCNNDIEPCNMDIAAEFYDDWAFPVSQSKLLGMTFPDFITLIIFILEITFSIYFGCYVYFQCTYYDHKIEHQLNKSQLKPNTEPIPTVQANQ